MAGYFIDLGVRHSERRSEFIAGVECDGATYHSSRSARDRDRIRQEILESLGWRGRIIRVWSTDWFADPRGQTQRLIDFLRAREQFEPEGYADEIDDTVLADLEPDNFDEVQNVIGRDNFDEAVLATEPDLVEVFADIGDRVTYETLDGVCERHTVQIVDSPSNLRLGLLNDGTPLAEVLLGLKAGEESVLKVAGQTPRRLKVLEVVRDKQSLL